MARTVVRVQTLLTADRVFDAASDDVLAAGAVLVEGERIEAVGPVGAVAARPGARRVDLGDRTLMPGLIDAHAHLLGWNDEHPLAVDRRLGTLRAADEARRVLEAGFTTIRECGGGYAVALRDAIAEGLIAGPRIVAAGTPITQTGGHFDVHDLPIELVREYLADEVLIADGVDACRGAARTVVRSGADLVKIDTTGGNSSLRDHPLDEHFGPDELEAIVEEAHRAGRRVAAHAQGADGVLAAVRAGVDSIEHGYFLDETCIDEMLARGTFLVPTFGLVEYFRRALDGRYGHAPNRLRSQEACIAAMERSFAMAREAGVPLAAGSDHTGSPDRENGHNVREVLAMIDPGGVPVPEALRIATIGGARVIGIEHEVGTLEPGKRADMIAVAGDPFTKPAALTDVDLVMTAGVVQHEVDRG